MDGIPEGRRASAAAAGAAAGLWTSHTSFCPPTPPCPPCICRSVCQPFPEAVQQPSPLETSPFVNLTCNNTCNSCNNTCNSISTGSVSSTSDIITGIFTSLFAGVGLVWLVIHLIGIRSYHQSKRVVTYKVNLTRLTQQEAAELAQGVRKVEGLLTKGGIEGFNMDQFHQIGEDAKRSLRKKPSYRVKQKGVMIFARIVNLIISLWQRAMISQQMIAM